MHAAVTRTVYGSSSGFSASSFGRGDGSTFAGCDRLAVWGRAFAVDNLFVAGSSSFGTAGASTPTYTLVALSLRLADHLLTDVLA